MHASVRRTKGLMFGSSILGVAIGLMFVNGRSASFAAPCRESQAARSIHAACVCMKGSRPVEGS
jgi:hypothetical protein